MNEGLNGEFGQAPLGPIKSRERLNDFADKFRELSDRWDNRLTVKGLSIAERYRRGDLGLLISYVRQGEVHHRCIAYHSAITRYGRGLVGMRMKNAAKHGRRDDQLMFVDNVEIMKGSKELVPSILSFVRL